MKLKQGSLLIAILMTLLFILAPAAQAVTASDWLAGRIIDDPIFTDKSSMSISDIQNFLNQRVGTGSYGIDGVCDTNGTRTSEFGGGTRAQYGASRGNPAPFTCLKDYHEVPKLNPGPEVPASNYGGVPIPAGAKSAANLIYDAAQAYNISPKVLLVTIQKESAGPLITDDWPLRSQYTYAMGAHCPDSGPGGSANCDVNYSGFSMQIAESAALMRYYLDNMSQPWWPYKKPGVNSVRYSPNASCGSTNVNIETSATAALYTYTPYQPNQAALNNMYGTGDGCSAYGNRNFWRMYNDWFGSTLGDLVRSVDNATVYLISNNFKYPISDGSVLNDFGSMGPIRFVSNAYLDTKTTGPTLGHMVGAPDGTLYFVNAGIKLSFSSCQMVAEFGYSCGQVINLTDGQLSRLHTGPPMTYLYGTTSGKQFYIQDGLKHEVFDQQSLTDAGITGAAHTLLEAGLNYLQLGLPVIREKAVAISRFNEFRYFYENNKFNYLAPDLANSLAFRNLPIHYLEDGSMPFTHRAMNFSGFVKNAASTQFYVLDNAGKASLTSPTNWVDTYMVMSDSMLSSIPNSTQPINNLYIKSSDNGTIYYVADAKKRFFSSWADFISLNKNSLPINTLSTASVTAIITGTRMLGPGQLAKYVNGATVYLVDGFSSLVPISTFAVPSDLGLGSTLSTVDTSTLDWYSKAVGVQTVRVQCDSKNYLGSRGLLYEIPSNMQTHYGLSYNPLDPLTCANTSKSVTQLNRFLHVSNGTIYYVESGQKRPITSYAKYLELGGNGTNTVSVSDFAASQLPTGALII